MYLKSMYLNRHGKGKLTYCKM